jgi:hypothetical protein
MATRPTRRRSHPGPAALIRYFLLGTLLLLTACPSKRFPGSYLFTTAEALRYVYQRWVSEGKPPDFDMARFVQPRGEFFPYTNTVTFNGAPHSCRFGSRRPGFPKGVLAITEDGVVVWIRDSDGEVTLKPDDIGIDRN